MVVSDFGDATTSALALVRSGVERAGATPGPEITIPLGVTDVEPYLADLVQAGVDGVVVFVAAPLQVGLIEQLRAAGYRGDIVVPSSVADRVALGLADTDGTLVVGEFYAPFTKAPNPGVRRYRSDGQAHLERLATNEGALNFWLAAWIFEHVATGLAHIDATSVHDALSTTTDLDTGGLTPPFSGSGGSAEFPRLLNPTVSYSRIEGGVVTPLSKHLFDPLTGSKR